MIRSLVHLFWILFACSLAGLISASSSQENESDQSFEIAPTIEIVGNISCKLGEAPYWDGEAQVLYYVDIQASKVMKYNALTGDLTQVILDKTEETPVSVVVPLAGETDKFLVTFGRALAILIWDGVSEDPTALDIITEVDQGLNTQFNDGKADARGRFWAGTMAPAEELLGVDPPFIGSLYSLNKDRSNTTRHLSEIGLSNGLAWTCDNKIMYYVDSLKYTIVAFDYDIETGEMKNQRVVFDYKNNNLNGFPDGLTIDKNGYLWSANFNGSAVHQVDPVSGVLLQSIEFPAPQISSVAWGGPNLDELYVTSGNTYGELTPQGGLLFKVTGLGTSGLPAVPVQL